MVQCAIDISLLLYMFITLLPSPSDCVLTVINTGQGISVPVLNALAEVHQVDGRWEWVAPVGE